jgi:EAL domain-containing protein (putative c-di-GMP-specific phosphodiesterase class I)/GGDEF domain-containing protein
VSARARGSTTAPTLLTDSADPRVAEAVALLPGWRLRCRKSTELSAGLDEPDVRAVLIESSDPNRLRELATRAQLRRLPFIVACSDELMRRRAVELRVDEWYRLPADAEEIVSRVRSALVRAASLSAQVADRVENVEYEEMLYDALSGLPTLPVMIERSRAAFKARGELIVFYMNFVRYSKIEEIYGWEKLDEVLETTAASVREFLDVNRIPSTQMMVGYTNDDDYIFFHVPPGGVSVTDEPAITEHARRLQQHVALRLETAHGEDIATLFDIYVGYSHLYYNPKIRLERLIYRGIREAANAARSVEQRERHSKSADLRQLLRDGSIYIDYHPICTSDMSRVFGYEALARGVQRSLRSPEVMFDVAAESDLLWELGRLCRQRALEGARDRLTPDQLIFLNVDPHDFADPAFGELHHIAPERVVIEITERTAIKDYPRFRERLQWFRDRGYRFAVDDAGSGYAGLGSIANLEPDFIKLDISLITSIDTNFIKQNLVETMVNFAEEHGAQVIAEGIEREEELETVRRLGVHLVQGFLLHDRGRRPHLTARPREQLGRAEAL